MSTPPSPKPANSAVENSEAAVAATEVDKRLAEEQREANEESIKEDTAATNSASEITENASSGSHGETEKVDTDHPRTDANLVENQTSETPPLPEEAIPPLPSEPLPDDGWEPRWEESVNAWYFYNRFTGKSQWDNPRVPEVTPASALQLSGPPGVSSAYATASAVEQPPELSRRPAGGYDPAIHGDYDPTAWYAQQDTQEESQLGGANALVADPAAQYAAVGAFNRFTGRWQNTDLLNPENFNDENKSKRQMNAFFDVDAAANSHDGRSLKAERSGKKVSKSELKQFKEKRKAKKEEKRRAWLRD